MANERKEQKSPDVVASTPASATPKAPAAPTASTPASTTPRNPATPATSTPATTTPKAPAAPATSTPASTAPKAPVTPATSAPTSTTPRTPAAQSSLNSEAASTTPINEIFTNASVNADQDENRIVILPLDELYEFGSNGDNDHYAEHPFRVLDDELMARNVETYNDIGMIQPAIVRPRTKGGYEILAGNRRKRMAKLAGDTGMPCIIKYHCDDAMAIKIMSATNDQRTPTDLELAESYRMYMESQEIVSKKGQRTDLKKTTDGKSTVDIISEIAEQQKKSRSTVRRYLNVSQLIPELKRKIEDKTLSVTAGSEFGTLSDKDQKLISYCLSYYDRAPTVGEAQAIHQLSVDGKLDEMHVKFIMDDELKHLIPEWVKTYEDKKVGDMTLSILADFSEQNQKEIYQAASELGKSPTIPMLRTIEDKAKGRPISSESIKSILDPSYKPTNQEKQDTPPPKSVDSPQTETAKPSTASIPGTPQAPNPDAAKDSHGAAPAVSNPPSHEPAATPSAAPVHTATPNGPAPFPPAPPEPPAPKEPGIFIPMDKVKKYFPKSFTPEKMEESIYKVLEAWHKKQEQKKAVSR